MTQLNSENLPPGIEREVNVLGWETRHLAAESSSSLQEDGVKMRSGVNLTMKHKPRVFRPRG